MSASCGCSAGGAGSCGCGGGAAYIVKNAKKPSCAGSSRPSVSASRVGRMPGRDPRITTASTARRSKSPPESTSTRAEIPEGASRGRTAYEECGPVAPADWDEKKFWAPGPPLGECADVDDRAWWDFCACHGTTTCDKHLPNWRPAPLRSETALYMAEATLNFEGHGIGAVGRALEISAWATLIQNYDLCQWLICCKSTFERDDDVGVGDLSERFLKRLLGLAGTVNLWAIADSGEWRAFAAAVVADDLYTGYNADKYEDWKAKTTAIGAVPSKFSSRNLPYPTLIAIDLTNQDWLRPKKRWKSGSHGKKPKTVADLMAADERVRAAAVLWRAQALLHELLHVSFGFGHPIVHTELDTTSNPNPCDTFYRIANAFVWAMSHRYKHLKDGTCLGDLSRPAIYDFGDSRSLESHGLLKEGCT